MTKDNLNESFDIENQETEFWIMSLKKEERLKILRDIKCNYRVTYEDLDLKILTPRHALRDGVVYDEPLHWSTANERVLNIVLAKYHEGKLQKIKNTGKELNKLV